MPARRHADNSLQQALVALRAALDATGTPWMIIGGIALMARGSNRATSDIDAAVQGDAIDVEALLQALAEHEIEPRIADPVDFAAANLVVLLRHRPTGVELDVSLAFTGFEHEALATRSVADFRGVRVPTASVESLMVYKALAGRPIDDQDLDLLLDLYPRADTQRVRAHLVALAEAIDQPEIVTRFDKAVRAVPPPRPKKLS